MRGERIIAELLSIVGMVVYGVILQHIYSQVMGRPDQSWVNQTRTWWVTRGSRAVEKKLAIWTLKDAAVEPPVELE